MSNNQTLSMGENKNIFQRTVPKFIVGLSVASITPIIATLVFVPLFMLVVGTEVGSSVVLGIWSGMCAIPIVILHVVFFGLPAAIIGYQLKMLRWWTCTLIGFLIAFIPTFIYIATTNLGNMGNSQPSQSSDWYIIPFRLLMPAIGLVLIPSLIGIFIGLFGSVGGFSFWVAWRFLNPQESLIIESDLSKSK